MTAAPQRMNELIHYYWWDIFKDNNLNVCNKIEIWVTYKFINFNQIKTPFSVNYDFVSFLFSLKLVRLGLDPIWATNQTFLNLKEQWLLPKRKGKKKTSSLGKKKKVVINYNIMFIYGRSWKIKTWGPQCLVKNRAPLLIQWRIVPMSHHLSIYLFFS